MKNQIIEYVVSRPVMREKVQGFGRSGQPAAEGVRSIANIVQDVAGVQVLNEVDSSTALVRMSETAMHRMQKAHPELIVEPNIQYYRRSIHRAG
ncbi:MAG: hypothetical protein K2R93_16560 [Gemmatimonadaceae bacterium]|nr:hypothetical protein [Gemmatimonadaceae bacterium]